ncbi:Calx-beta domain-containing protein [Vibrio hepatarius]|uniref:Calx-beta domain-containing protein n=1 Tax=Vibrio hepatarius TaxID=171383 RepID=UPI001C08F6ED|nr:VWA domain-containing protein [Vibrio hepatarius]
MSVQTQDDSIFEGSETFTLSANASATVGGDSFNLTDSGTGTITDDSDRPQVSIVGGGDVAEGDTANFTVQLSNTATSAVSFVLALNAGDTSSQDLSAYQYQTTDGTWQDVPDSGEIVVPAGSDSVNVKVVTEQDSVYEGDESFSLSVSAGNGTVLAPTSTSASATILDFADNPPQAEDFTVTLDPSGNAGIFFNSNDAAQDHISDSEDDSTHTPLGVVITELPQSGQLYYDNQLINTGDLTTFSANGEVIHQGTVFADPNLIRYANDTESTGFVLGVKQAPEGMDGATSQSDFLNWGEPVQGNSAQRVMQFENGDTITITSSGQSFTQYFGDANHIGYGLGVGNDGGIQQGETITLDFSDRPSTSVEVGLDGLGGWFEEGHNKETAAVIQARLDDGSLIEVPVTKETSGNSNLFHIATIDAPEGRQIDALIVTTDGPGNWELRYLEASSNDTFEYRAVDSDNNYSDENSVTLVESNDAPVATDDPVAFDVALGTFNLDSWSHDGVSVSASYQGQDKSITQSGVKRGVSGDENGGPGAQIQYNREEGESEQLKVSLDKPATEFSFAISNLYKDEGGSGNHEQGKWVAYLGDNPVASGTFVANESNNRGSYHFDEQDLGGVAFDSVVFEAIDFTHIPARGSDASDYFLTGFKASGEGAYAANQGDVVEIPLTALLGNDVDPNGDNIRITHLSEVNHADARIENGIVYIDLDDDFVGDTSFDYVITDDKGGYAEATVSMVVNPLPQDVAVNSISMFEDSVIEGEDLVYQVSLDEGVLQETRYSVTFGQPGSDSADNTDVDLSNVMFTHGVTYDAAAQQVVVPVGVNAFSVVIPTVLDGTYEHTEAYTLTLGGQQATGTIENADIPQVSVSEGGSISEGSAAEFTVSLSKNTAEAVTVNVSLAHLDTDSADISVMEAAYQNGESWQAISIAPNGDVILPAGVTQVRVTVQTMDDNAQPVYEGPERFELTVTGVDGAEGSASSISTIVDDGSVGSDDDRPIIESVSDVTVAEGNDAIFNVTLSSESNTDTHVILELKERKASSPEDYDGRLVTVTYGDPQQAQTLPILNGLFEFDLPAGETDFSVAVKTVDDEVSENNETFLLVAKTDYQSNQVSAKATIEDNEKPVIDLDGSQYQIEFVSEDAGYRNVFGYYVYDPDSETQQLQILMSDSHDSRQSSFEPVLVTLGSLDNVEYFLIADGAGLVDSVTLGASFEVDTDGRLIINGNIQPNTKVLLSHDEASLMRTSVNDNGDTIINFDDQVDHAHDDNDYDDLVIKIAKQDTNIDYSTDFVEGDGAVSIVDTDADIFDDKDSIQSMHVLLNKVYEGDQLTWSAMSGFSVNQTNTATGLSLLITSNVSGGVSAAEFEAFLEGIKYENISENPDETVREIDVYVTDSYGQSSETATTTITVSKVADLIVEQNSVGIEDGDITLNVTVPQGSSVTGVVLNNLPQGVVLKSGNDLVPINNGEARLTSQQLSQLTITPPNDSDDNFIVNVNGYTSSNELIEEHTINVQVDAVTDIPTITVSDAEVISQQDFDSIELGNSSWRGNVTSSELTQADGVEGTWGTDNSNNYNEVGKETVYRGGVLDKTNHIYELEGRNGDDQVFTQFNAEAGQFYTLSFDVVARRVNDSPMTVFLEDESGHREVLFEYTDQQSINWQTENINFQTSSDGDYKVVFESETSSNSYGALLDDIRLEKADNIGFENSYIPLSDILVSLSDSDGSETLSLILNGLPEDTIIRDGNGNSMTVVATVDGKNSTDLSAWSDDLTELEVYVSNDGVYPLEFIVSAQDNVPANTESVSKVVNLTVLPSFITYEFESGSHGNDVITGNDDHEVIVGDVQGIQIIAGQDYNIAFVLDTSGSMRNTVGQAKSEILEVFDQLHSTVNSGPNAGKVNILLTEFSTSTGVIISVDLNSPTAREDFVAQLSDIEDSGSGFTNYEASFDATIEWFDASTNSQAENITYFITDGNPNYIQRSKIGESQFDELVLDFDTSTKNLVTLEDILPPDYILGSSVTYKGQEIISDTGMVKSPLTGAGLGNITNSNGLRYSDSNSITIQTRHMYQLLALVSSIEAIGIGNGINAATLSQYDTDGAVVSNINVDQLAETVLGQEIALEQGEDQILGGHGDDILFGDLINFDNIDGQGVSALQKYVAAETRSPLVDVSAEEVSNFVRQHYTEFDVSRDGDQNDILSGGSGNDVLYGQGGNDILDGGSGNDILLGGEGDDILIGGLGSDILSGGAGHDQFVWRDNELDGGTDVITDFHVSEDKIDISDLLTAGETMDDLLPDISANAIDNNIELTIHRDSGQYQSIKLENVADQLSGLNINHGNIVGNDLTDLLNEIIVM